MWTGAKYAVTDELDVIGAYYAFVRIHISAPRPEGPPSAPTVRIRNAPERTMRFLPPNGWRFAPKWDLYFGMMFNQVHGGLGFGFLQHSNIDPTVGVRFKF